MKRLTNHNAMAKKDNRVLIKPNAKSAAGCGQTSRQLQQKNSSFFLEIFEQIALIKIATNPALPTNDLSSPRRHLNKITEVKYPLFCGKSSNLPALQKLIARRWTNHLSCPPSAVIVQCDRALGRNARGKTVAHYKKSATTASHKFFRTRACFRPKTARTLRCRRAGRAAGGGAGYANGNKRLRMPLFAAQPLRNKSQHDGVEGNTFGLCTCR